MKKSFYIKIWNHNYNDYDLLLCEGEILTSSYRNYKYFICKNESSERKGYTAYDLITGFATFEKKTKKELIKVMNDPELIEAISNAYKIISIEDYKELLLQQFKINKEENITVKNLYDYTEFLKRR